MTIQDGSTTGSVYTYLYDAFQRRRYKEYPLGAADEYFYDLGHQLLEDRGSSTVSSSAPYPEDDYVWLDGRPLAYVRGQITSAWHRNSDSTATCSRLGDSLPCGIYYIVTDHIGKPVLALNSAASVVGVYDYDVFGTMNRQVAQAGTGVYANNLGSTNCATNTNVLLDFTQHPAASGLKIDMRTRFHQVDTESAAGTPHDYAQVRDGDTGTCLNASPTGTAKIGGQHNGAPVGSWVTPSAGHLKVMFYSDAQNECPNGSGGLNCTCSSCTTSGTCSTCSYPYTGVSLEAADYREYKTGTTPLLLPLRFPGQYYDAETDFFENWNRFYDPSVGRYLELEPMLQWPWTFEFAPVRGQNVGAFDYAENNPVQFTDASGLAPGNGPLLPGPASAVEQCPPPKKRTKNSCFCVCGKWFKTKIIGMVDHDAECRAECVFNGYAPTDYACGK